MCEHQGWRFCFWCSAPVWKCPLAEGDAAPGHSLSPVKWRNIQGKFSESSIKKKKWIPHIKKQTNNQFLTWRRPIVVLISCVSPTVTILDLSIWVMRTSQSASSVAVSLRSVGATVSGVCGVWWCGSSLTKLAICTAEGTADTGAGAGGRKRKKRKKSWSKQGLTYRAPLKGNDATNVKDVRRREVVLSKGSQRIVAPHQIMTNEPSGTVLVCYNLCRSPLTCYF